MRKAGLSCAALVPLTLITLVVRIEFFQVKRRAAIIVHYCNFPEKTHFTIPMCTGGDECALKRAQRGQERHEETDGLLMPFNSIPYNWFGKEKILFMFTMFIKLSGSYPASLF